MIPSGRLNQRIQIQRPETVVDEYGQEVDTWVTVSTQWAQIIGNGGGTGIVVNKGQVTYSHTVITRNCKALASMDELWRILYQSRILNITTVQPDDRHKDMLTISCAEEKV